MHEPIRLNELFDVIVERQKASADESYVASLNAKGQDAILRKVMEEALEVVLAAKGESQERLVEELADLWFHQLVFMAQAGIHPNDIRQELTRRFGQSGLKNGEPQQ